MFLFLTADQLNLESGGSLVCRNESTALQTLGPANILDRSGIQADPRYEPWSCDMEVEKQINPNTPAYQLCHIYSGTWGKTVKKLKGQGCKVSITIAAHDKDISREEHEKYTGSFPYPHLVDPELWKRYIEGYRLADVIICPGTVPAETVRRYGPDFENKRIEIIPHGCEIPDNVALPPERFTVGYLGAIGFDKGLIYLLQAWKKLNYKDALLVIAGKDSTSQMMYSMLEQFGGGAVCLAGWQENVSSFYNGVSLYCQPSATEGMGLEVVEAMAHARPVICSRNAGACDLLAPSMTFPARNVDALAEKIDYCKKMVGLKEVGIGSRSIAKSYSWSKIKEKYIQVWRSML